MQNARRLARELALKVLFQVDVGKQPLLEVLEGAQEQVRATVESPVTQVLRDAQKSLRELANRRAEELSAEMSTQSARQLKQITTALLTELQKLADAGVEQLRLLLTKPISDASRATDAGQAQFAEAVENTIAALRRLGSRDSHYPQLLAEVQALAEKRAQQMKNVFVRHLPDAVVTASLMRLLIEGTIIRREEIDGRLDALSTGWGLERQAAVDRNIMRLAAYEILYLADIPSGATINEAVELAKKYSTAESGRFVNGILGALAGGKDGVKGAGQEGEKG